MQKTQLIKYPRRAAGHIDTFDGYELALMSFVAMTIGCTLPLIMLMGVLVWPGPNALVLVVPQVGSFENGAECTWRIKMIYINLKLYPRQSC